MKRFIWSILHVLNRYIAKPKMVLGYKNRLGTCLNNTRISNTVDIVQADKLDIADNVFIAHYTILDCSNRLSIGEGCQICAYVQLLTHSSHIAIRLYGKHYIEYNGQHEGYIKGSTSIGKYTFIGPHSVIMPNAHIGKGSIVNAYSYVKSGSYPDFAILAGNPATVIGDTRKLDAEFLELHPNLKHFYNEWANYDD